ncbi:MAG: tRNA lysidine(34) synthetase TilS [Elainellaceae cyanobacterium]
MPPPWSPIHARLHHTLRQQQLLPQGCGILAAVSGGQDSLALMQLLIDLQPKWRWTLAIAHCNHRWRPDSDDNAAYVAQLAQQWNLPCHLATVPEGDIGSVTSEAAARNWRYGQLARIAAEHGHTHVVTGHTASDRAETVLYNLIRGSGMDGLQSLAWCRKLAPPRDETPLWLIRPMLNIFRQETAQICADAGLSIWEDETNQDLRYARNRTRHELIPYLKTAFNPNVDRALAQTAEVLRAEVAYLDSLVDSLWTQTVTHLDEDVVDLYAYRATDGATHPSAQKSRRHAPSEQQRRPSRLTAYRVHRLTLQRSPLALQRRLLRRLLIHTDTAAGFNHIEALVQLLDAPNRSQTAPLSDGVVGQVDGEWITFRTLPAE